MTDLNREQGQFRIETDATHALAEITDLHREFPAWAIWLPLLGCGWAALRPASTRRPEPNLPMVWVHAETSAELADRMRSIDAQVAGRAG